MRRWTVCLRAALTAIVAVAMAAADYRSTAASAEAARIVAIGDVHGAAESFAAILKKAGLIDGQQRWAGGKAVLVQTGDMSDRGTGMRAALDLLMALEEQARKAGGRVHAILGNHEVMNLVGETRDGTPEIFATFGGEAAMREAFGPRGRYGKWLRSKPVIAEIDDSIFLHGGINLTFSDASVAEINRRARRELAEWDAGVKWLEQRKLVSASPKFLDAVEAARVELERLATTAREHPDTPETARILLPLINIGTSSLFSPDGPLWYRGFSTWSDAEGAQRIADVLKKLGGKRFVTGHTVQSNRRITERFDGRLFLIDTGMFFPSGRASALEIVDDATRPLYLDE
jgi:hypothetical protein